MNKKEIWNNNLEKEIMWWKKKWLNNPNSSFPYKTNPKTEVQEYISKWFSSPFPDNFKILDVGAGPLTHIGKKYNEKFLNIIAVDALADEYNKFVEEIIHKFNLRQKTKKCQTENLRSIFNENEFDIVHARNTLDHSHDPIKCFKQMIEVCKTNGYIITYHEVKEGSNEKWQGLHQ